MSEFGVFLGNLPVKVATIVSAEVLSVDELIQKLNRMFSRMEPW